ncbi:MAG: putative 4-hydroxybenzoate polyprenyltransferase [Armatimonadetes bacterium]|nr:putative 4-hydroxybenzoate polyprenyltransferase [Armatimonadota bacterium]MDE2207928.1 putative 4-hydroxybenzoate polyprenyltransferase [Armatimonadota bacterium]
MRQLLELVKFEHTVFALPFALIAFDLAWRLPHPQRPITAALLWIVTAMAAARTGAMAFNRLADSRLDARNPRTAGRHLPAGILTAPQVWLLFTLAVAMFEGAAWQLNWLCLELSPIAWILLLGYSYSKRFTWLCHFWLGAAIGLAPSAVWIAVTGSVALTPLLLSATVMLWIGGFDILYSLQDLEHDRNAPVYSLPKQFGPARALAVSRTMHAMMVLLLVWLGWAAHLHLIYAVGVVVTAGLVFYEQLLVKADDFSRLNLAFFTLNGWVSVCLLVFVWLDTLVKLPR